MPLVKLASLKPTTTLQPHQQRVVERFTGDSPRMLLYHGLGTGKTLSAIAAAQAAKGQWGAAMPASLRENFLKEIHRHTSAKPPPVLSYTELGMGKTFPEGLETLVLDEAARLRNPDTASGKQALTEAAKAKRLLLLSGTPVVNAPGDLAPLVSMLSGKNITPKAFEERFVAYDKVQPSLWQRLTGVKAGDKARITNEAELRELFRGKVDYQAAKSPEGVAVSEEVVKAPLSPEQVHLQEAIMGQLPASLRWKLNSEFPLSRTELQNLGSFLTGLRQVSLSTLPFRKDLDGITAYQQSPKLQAALQLLQKTLQDPRKKAIVYSNFIRAGLEPYAAALKSEKIPYGYFYGGLSSRQRQENLDRYNQGKTRVLLLGPAGAEGISTKGTSLIQLLDPHWNEARSSQARGRGLRFDSHEGLPDDLKNVAVQRFVSTSQDPSFLSRLLGAVRVRTGDEILERLSREKQELNDQFLSVLRQQGQTRS